MKKFFTSDTLKAFAFGILLTGIVVLLFKNCGGETKPVQSIDLKPELKKQDSFRTVIRYHDSTRLTVLKKWKTITKIHDSVKCYEEIKYIIQACDTIIKIDSVQIASLKGLVRLDSNIQVILFKRIRSDSVLITKLNKKVKRNRTLAKLAFVTGLFGGGYLGVKVAR